jgi:hypothetical protein
MKLRALHIFVGVVCLACCFEPVNAADVQVRCQDFEKLADGNWKIEKGTTIKAGGSDVHFSYVVIEPHGMMFDSRYMYDIVESQCGKHTESSVRPAAH